MVKGLIKSLLQLSQLILFKQRPDIIFYSPQLFNRSKQGTNSYYEPLIKLCIDNKIKYLLLEEPSGKYYNSDKRALKADVIFWFAWFMHKIMIKGMHRTLHETDKKIGRIIDNLTFHKLRAETYITISNSMIDVLGEINPQGNVYDYQHGIIYYGHRGYFLSQDELRPEFTISNRKVLLWGELYKQNLINLPNGISSDDKFIVVGYPLYQKIEINNKPKDKVILVSLQFTSDISSEVSAGMVDMLDEFASEATKHGYRLLLKHHPRFANEVDLEPLINKYSGKIEMTSLPLAELAEKSKLHVTWGSTSALEYAAYGVPTYFLCDKRFDWATEIFYRQYSYPLYDGISYSEMLQRIENKDEYTEDCKTVKEWYESAYSPLNEELLLTILKGEYNEKK